MRRLALMVAVGVFFFLTLRKGHDWGDDFAQYLEHAQNIAAWKPYTDIGYIYNPLNPGVGPRAYPPVFPLVLAPVLACFGVDLGALKVLMVLLILTTLFLTDKLASREFNDRERFVFLLAIGLCPVFWMSKDRILSEHLFIPLWYAAILVADQWYNRRVVLRSETFHGVVLGLLIYLAYGTRLLGIVLVPTIVLCEATIARRLTRVGVLALLTSGAGIVAQRLMLPAAGGGYAQQLRGLTPFSLVENSHHYASLLSDVWRTGYSPLVSRIAFFVFGLIGLRGFLRNNLSKPSVLGIALSGYCVALALWPSQAGVRFVLPLAPGYFFYALVGMRSSKASESKTSWGPLVLGSCVVISYAGAYFAADYGPVKDGVESPAAIDLFRFVQGHSRPDEVVLFFKPRALALYTGRRASAYPITEDPRELWGYAKSIGVALVIVQEGTDRGTAETLVASTGRELLEVYRGSAFRVYRWAPRASPSPMSPGSARNQQGMRAPGCLAVGA